eukprot:TRINITY_DN39455_c0_g1_i2.p2 TRINITY_DN39455_c0_g1~~TRINITY_DN39455_c0_g1_i2.p2  ORF type:complete len:136 (-),score=9.21 TRINITY_DN39455_c0_g1_i2:284-691(-)
MYSRIIPREDDSASMFQSLEDVITVNELRIIELIEEFKRTLEERELVNRIIVCYKQFVYWWQKREGLRTWAAFHILIQQIKWIHKKSNKGQSLQYADRVKNMLNFITSVQADKKEKRGQFLKKNSLALSLPPITP